MVQRGSEEDWEIAQVILEPTRYSDQRTDDMGQKSHPYTAIMFAVSFYKPYGEEMQPLPVANARSARATAVLCLSQHWENPAH